jgi:hypothetical protein
MSRVSGCMDSLLDHVVGTQARGAPEPDGRASRPTAGGHKFDGVHMSENNVSGASQCSPKPHPELRRLDPLVGKWRARGSHPRQRARPASTLWTSTE